VENLGRKITYMELSMKGGGIPGEDLGHLFGARRRKSRGNRILFTTGFQWGKGKMVFLVAQKKCVKSAESSGGGRETLKGPS